MTINEAIRTVDKRKPNTHNDEEKVAWLEMLDRQIVRTVIRTHAGGEDAVMPSYDPDTDMDTDLLAEAPHDAIYIWWLMAQMDLVNQDINQYNVDITMFNADFDAYKQDYTRHHIPRAAGARFLF